MTTTPTIWAGPITVSTLASARSSSIAPLAEGGYVVAFQRTTDATSDVAAIRYTDLGAQVNVNLLASAATDTLPLTNPQSVQLAGGQILTAFSRVYSNIDNDVYGAINNAGTYSGGSRFVIDVSSDNDPIVLAVEAALNGEGVVLWQRITGGVKSLRLDFITPEGAPTPPSENLGNYEDADLAVLANGNIALVYEPAFPTSNSSSFLPLKLSLYDPLFVFAPFREVNVGLAGSYAPEIEALVGGGLVVVWDDINFNGLYGDVFSPSGVSLSGLARGNTLTPSESAYGQQVTALLDGGYIVGWTEVLGEDPGGDPDWSIVLQRYNAQGSAVGTRFTIDTTSYEKLEDIQTLSDGRVVVSWLNGVSPASNDTTLRTMILDPREASLTFSDTNDSVVGRLDDTTINAGAGDDKLTGMGGDDDLNGQAGNDTLKGGAGDDVLKGGSGTDSLDGGSGADQLFGGSGSDLVTGGSGRDVLWGQTGNDVFRYLLASESGTTTATQDIIRDFIQTEDKIDLAGIDAKLGVAGNEAFVFIGGAAFSAEGQVRAVTVGGFTRVEMNTTGASGLEGAILVEGVIAFTSSDFIL